MIHVRRHLAHESGVRGVLEGTEVRWWLVRIRMHINVQINMTGNVDVLGHLGGHPLGCRWMIVIVLSDTNQFKWF